MKNIMLAIALFAMSISAVHAEECSGPSEHTQQTAQIINDLEIEQGALIAEQVFRGLSGSDKIELFNLLSNDNKIKFWEVKLSRLIEENDFSKEQIEFIEYSLEINRKVINGDIDKIDLMKVDMELNIRAKELFGAETAHTIFSVAPIEKEAYFSPQEKHDSGTTIVQSLPVCNCNTTSTQSCSVCRAGAGSTCSWRNDGCGTYGWWNCNGRCMH